MKRTNSITTAELHSELIASKNYLFESSRGKLILDVLMKVKHDIKTAYVLAHTPEQGEDIFRILVDGENVVGFDFQYHDDLPVALNLNLVSVQDYKKNLKGRVSRIRLEIAIELSRIDLGKS